jgi:hypothetical protein
LLFGEITGSYNEHHKNAHKYIVWAKCGVINVAARGTIGLAIGNLKN